MIKRIFLLLVICFMGVAALADDWQKGRTGIEYNCELLTGIAQAFQDNDSVELTSLGQQTLVRANNVEINVATYFGITDATTAQLDNRQASLLGIVNAACNPEEADKYAATLFNVQIDNNSNIRSCANIDCTVVRQASGGEMLSVVGMRGDWYEVREGSGTAYIAKFLVRRVMCL